MAFHQTTMLPKNLHSDFNIPKFSCTVTNNGQYHEYKERQAQYPRPTEIGNVGTPVQIKHLNSGKVLAWSSLAVEKSSADTFWINLTFWDELAHVAFQHVEKGQQIYVSGRLVSDTVEGKQQIYYKVVVSELNFIKRSTSPVSLYDGKRPKIYAANSTGSVEELWQAFFANPVEWWDNRKNKRSPKYPDFKHKDTGEALWVEGRYNPPVGEISTLYIGYKTGNVP